MIDQIYPNFSMAPPMVLKVFVGNHENRLDSKNRLSIPAQFRDVLKSQAGHTEPLQVFACPDYDPYSAEVLLFCYSETKVAQLEAEKSNLDPYHPRHIEIRNMQSQLRQLALDGEGRIQLSDSLKQWAGLGDTVAVVGVGDCFYLSTPESLVARRDREMLATKSRIEAMLQARATATNGGVK